jgi:hypothetical protein
MGRNSQRRRAARTGPVSDTTRPDVSEISRVRAATYLRADIATWMKNPSDGPGGSFIEGRHPADPTVVFAVLMHWLVSARESISGQQARDAVAWLSDTLGISDEDLVFAAGLIGHPDAPSVTLNEGMERYGKDEPVTFVLYMLLLAGSLVATVGDGDPNWLRQFDLRAE